MINTRNKLYGVLLIACLAGYVWLYLNYAHPEVVTHHGFGGCVIKHVTDVPCPSCGTTRAILALLEGDILNAFMINPFGMLVLSIMIIAPLWIAYDGMSKKETLYKCYGHIERALAHKPALISFVTLVTINWIWNIYKGL